ncbi:MAG: hypothetical protein ABI461_00460 [Polyangiaceae bacterium]
MISKRANAIASLATPALSFATLAIALGLGAHGETIAALVYGAPPGIDRQGLAWQVEVMLEDRGVREVKPGKAISTSATWKGTTQNWSGVTSTDGAAEMTFNFPGIAPGDELDLDVRAADGVSLARSRAHVPPARARGSISRGALPALRRDGAIGLDVAILGGGLAAEFPSELWVHARDQDGHSISAARIHFNTVDGLTFGNTEVSTCSDGWAKVFVTASALNAEGTITAKSGAFSGSWTGALPIVLGSTRAIVNQDDAGNLHADVARPLVTPSNAYVEIDDGAGRLFATTVPLVPTGNDFARAVIDLPKLADGTYWIVSSSEPRAAETMAPGAFAVPFRVGKNATDPCPGDGELATMHAGGFARSIVADGFTDARIIASRRRKQGISITFAALALGALVETLLILRAAKSGANVKASWMIGTAGTVAVGVGLSLLGFALLAAFVATH